MLEIKFGHELNVQRYTWHARLPNNAIHNNVICITQNYWYHDIFTQIPRHFYTEKIVSK